MADGRVHIDDGARRGGWFASSSGRLVDLLRSRYPAQEPTAVLLVR